MLTDRQVRFVEAYLLNPNATAAAVKAGYSPRTAGSQGQRLLKNVEVQGRIEEAQRRRAERTRISADRVLQELARIAFSDLRAVLDWGPAGVALRDSGDLSDDAAATVAEISQTVTKDGGTIRARLHSKMDALEKLARHLGMFDASGQATDSPLGIAREIKGALRAMTAQTHGGNEGDSIPFWARGGMNTIQPSDNGGDSNGADGK